MQHGGRIMARNGEDNISEKKYESGTYQRVAA